MASNLRQLDWIFCVCLMGDLRYSIVGYTDGQVASLLCGTDVAIIALFGPSPYFLLRLPLSRMSGFLTSAGLCWECDRVLGGGANGGNPGSPSLGFVSCLIRLVVFDEGAVSCALGRRNSSIKMGPRPY